MTDTKLAARIGRLLEPINAPLRIYNEQGECILPEGGEPLPLPMGMASCVSIRQGADWLRATETPSPVILAISEKVPGGKDLLCMAEMLLTNLLRESGSNTGVKDVYRRILRHDLAGNELNEVVKEYQLVPDLPRSVILFHLDGKASAYEVLGEVLPQSQGDILISMGRKQAVLVKDMQSIEGPDELFQFAEAVQETLQEEMGMEAIIGIGDEMPGLSTLYRSYQEALRAIEAGRSFRPGDKIHMFRHLLMERFLLSVPREIAQPYHKMLFNESTEKLFTDEILHTIETFYDKDLNLSDTARALYIHRNTLVYRLDKIQKQTGLDLRHFNDAVAFKILYELKIADEEKPKQIL